MSFQFPNRPVSNTKIFTLERFYILLNESLHLNKAAFLSFAVTGNYGSFSNESHGVTDTEL